jgi:hypothetical protein
MATVAEASVRSHDIIDMQGCEALTVGMLFYRCL